MKEYNKIYSVDLFLKDINNILEKIKKMDNNYTFEIEQDTDNDNYFKITIYYKKYVSRCFYNTIDTIYEYLKGILYTLYDIKD